MAAAAIDAGCRFFSGYPMLPFTGLLRCIRAGTPARRRCVHASRHGDRGREHGAWGPPPPGPAPRPVLAAKASRSMQETIAEAALNELPFVVFNDRPRPAGLLPDDARWRLGRLPHHRPGARERRRGRRAHPARVRARRPMADAGDPLRRPHDRLHADDASSERTGRCGQAAAGEAVGARRQQRRHRPLEGHLDLAAGQAQHPGRRAQPPLADVAEKYDELAAAEAAPRRATTPTTPRSSSCRSARPAPSSTTSSTSCAPTATASGRSGRSRSGRSRATRSPPSPAATRARLVLVHELNAGQMIDDVRLAVEGATPGARHRRREPGRVGHAPGRPPRRST